MTKSDLVIKIAEIYPYMSIQNVEKVLSIVIDSITTALEENRRVELRGFGVFGVKARKSTQRRNPRTGEKVFVEEHRVPFFKPGKQLKEIINEK